MNFAVCPRTANSSQGTASAKARVIENALRVRLFDPEWTLPSLRDQNPLVWMAEVDGLLVDLRQMPREVQEIGIRPVRVALRGR
jgi:hypothetical protein